MSFSIRILNRLNSGFSTPFSEFSSSSQLKGTIRSHGKIFSHAEFLDFCLNSPTEDIPFLWQEKALSGQFSGIIETYSHWLLCVDPIRSYPLYYWFSGSTLTVSDAVLPGDRKPNPSLLPEFLWLGFVSGADTLDKGVKQVLAGQCVMIHKTTGHVQSFVYASHKSTTPFIGTSQDALELLRHEDTALWDRFVEEVGDRPIWIPLSGGYDGRYILAALLQRGLKNQIRCYTYGRLGSFEMNIAKRVATQCDVPWTPILFSETTWSCFQDTDSQQFLASAFSGNSVPQWMEWVAFRQLITCEDIPLNAVIVPGHSGDFLGGSHLKSELGTIKSDYTSYDLITSLFRHHGRLIAPTADEKLQISIHLSSQFPTLSHWDISSFASAIESWNVLNRQSKFISNACQAYSFFGYDWKLPLWDYSFCSFWYALPLTLRWNSSLYHKFLFDTYFSPLEIDFKPPVTITKRGVLSQFQRLCPRPVYQTLKNWAKDIRRESVDFNGWQWLNDELQKHIDSPISYRDREDHALLAKWLVQKIQI